MTTLAPPERQYLTYYERTFIWRGPKESYGIPKLAGMTWAVTKGFYWTRDWEVAIKLAPYANASCREMLTPLHERIEVPRLTAATMSWAQDADIEIPAPEGLDYLPYQKAGVAYTLRKFDEGGSGVLIGDEPGLGKTIMACGVINARKDIKRVLVVCPSSLKINWRRELETWLVDRPFIGIPNQWFPTSLPVVIVNYDVLHKYLRAIKSLSWDLLVIDEGHLVKNPGTRRAKSLFAIDARYRLMLTGTPIVNRPAELWPLISYLAPTVFDDQQAYIDTYCGVKVDTRKGREKLNELQKQLRATVMVRRLKKDVLKDLPDKTRQVIEFPAEVAKQAVEEEQNMAFALSEEMFTLTLAMEMAKANPVEDRFREAQQARTTAVRAAMSQLSRLRHLTALAKVPASIAHIREALSTGQKVVLFAWHRDVMSQFFEEFKGVAVEHNGDKNNLEKQAAVDAFQKDPKTKLFIGNIKSAGVGLTLTRGSWVIFHELDWVPGNMTQAEDRCHRLTQKDAVLVQHLVLEGSLDANIAHALVEKQKVIDACLDATEREELARDPVVPNVETPATADLTYGHVTTTAATIGPDTRAAVLLALPELAALSDGVNRVDAAMIQNFQAASWLSDREVVLARRIARKYRMKLTEETRKVLR